MDRLEQIELQRRARPIIRTATAHLLAYKDYGRSAYQAYLPDVAKQAYPKDKDVPTLIRAASTITSMTGATQFIETQGVADFMATLSPYSAGTDLLSRSLQLSFDGAGVISVSGVQAVASNMQFVQEGAPIPVEQPSLTNVLLTPTKLASITIATLDLFNHSIPTIESVVKDLMSQSVGVAIDTALFDTAAASAIRPAGLRNNINTLVPSVLTPRSEAMAADLAALVTSVAPVASNSPIVLIAAPAQAAALRLWNNPSSNFAVLSSSSLAARTVIAVATNCIVSAVDPVPRFDFSTEGTIHMENVMPLQIGTVGAPPTVAAPTRSLFQTSSIGLRTIMEVSWGLRNAAGLAYIDLVNW